MKKINKLHLIWVVTLILLVAGVLLSLQSFREFTAVDKKMRAKLRDIDVMRNSLRELSAYTAAKEAYQLIPGAHPVKFESVIDITMIAQENIRSSEVSLDDDWFILRKEVVIDDGDISAVMTLIKKLEAQRPPWKLSSLNIKSSPVAPGRGRMVLLFEALEQR